MYLIFSGRPSIYLAELYVIPSLSKPVSLSICFNTASINSKRAFSSLSLCLASFLDFSAAFVSPFFGSISDQSQKSKNLLIFTTLIYSLISISFWIAVPGQINLMFIIIFIFIGNIAYEISQIFYNGQLKLISDKDNYAKLSGLAWGLGYAGTVIIFIIYFVTLGIS